MSESGVLTSENIHRRLYLILPRRFQQLLIFVVMSIHVLMIYIGLTLYYTANRASINYRDFTLMSEPGWIYQLMFIQLPYTLANNAPTEFIRPTILTVALPLICLVLFNVVSYPDEPKYLNMERNPHELYPDTSKEIIRRKRSIYKFKLFFFLLHIVLLASIFQKLVYYNRTNRFKPMIIILFSIPTAIMLLILIAGKPPRLIDYSAYIIMYLVMYLLAIVL